MDPQASPPKRMTRARAAKVGESSTAVRTTRIVTASAKAKTTRGTATASTKRKTRADEVEDEDNNDQDDELAEPQPAPKTRTRGRPKKNVEPEPEVETAPATRTRGRPKKVAEPSKEEPQPVKPATRTTRTKKTAPPEIEVAPEPVKKPATRTRGSATAPTKSTAAKSAAAAKKTVKFEEPEKENIEPAPAKATRGKAAETTTTTGLRAKPVRKAAAATTTARASTRSAGAGAGAGAGTTKTSGQESKYEKPTPLSPKKVTQMAMHNRANLTNNPHHNDVAESEDELAADEKTPTKPRAKAMSGVRARGGMKLQVPRVAAPKTTTSDENDMETETPAAPVVILGSPCRRPPPSPWKDSMKTPAKRLDGVPALAQSAVRPSVRLFDGETGQHQQQPQSAFKTSLFSSPAKRPQSAMKGLDLRPAGSTQLGAPSPFKTSLFSPPKRPISPSKPSFLGLSSPRKQQQDEEPMFGRTPAPKPTLLATPLAAESSVEGANGRHAGEVDIPEDVEEEEREPNRLLFPGRMSAVLPRHADPALDQEQSEHEASECEEEQQGKQPEEDWVDLVAEDHPAVEDQEVEDDQQQVEEHADEDQMNIDEPEPELPSVMARLDREGTTTPPASPPQQQQQQATGIFGLREKDLNPVQDQDTESEDEDELAASASFMPATPCRPPTSRSATTTDTGDNNAMSVRSANFGDRSTVKRARTDDKFGFTPLVSKLNAWGTASSPLKMGRPESPGVDILSQDDEQTPARAAASPMRNTYFDEAIAQNDVEAQQQNAVDNNVNGQQVEEATPTDPMETDDYVLTPDFDDIPVTEEDISLAAEAHEMSLLEPAQVDELIHNHNDVDALSEASQEYGDENAIPIDPTLLLVVPPVTPQRNFSSVREVRTTSKVPLKPADDSTPRPRVKRRGHSISRLPVQRPNQGLQRNATVISYSPTKQRQSLSTSVASEDQENKAEEVLPVTPAKSAAEWSTAGTPARTPRPDLDAALLRGAVVFVDVHTSEGADASGIFVELLAQMGARCVKTWAWNPSTTSPPQDGQAKIGITHVVYKDGGKRTLEKVRESGGVVQCVGVSWVLDCERENKWLDEAPYYIDTTLVPRGGARRRKSMEPKALRNMNGTVLVDNTPKATKPSARDCQSLPATPLNTSTTSSSRRRDSSLWMRTPPEQVAASPDEAAAADDSSEWGEGISLLMPVPKTPAPEAVARYAAAVALESTPTTVGGGESEDGYGDENDDGERKREMMMTRTCPPKSTSVYHELGEGILKREKDEGVLMRLMAARRKSLQFAPKVGSPLARAWMG